MTSFLRRCLPLACACALMLGAGAPAFADDANGLQSERLQRAAFEGDMVELSEALAAGGSVDSFDEHGYTPLIWAAQQGHADAVALLLARGAKVDLTDKKGYTALIWAAQQGQVDVMKQLLAAGAAIAPREKHGYSALDWASRQGHLDAVKLLLAHGADPALHFPNSPTPLELARRSGNAELIALLSPRPAPKPVEDVPTRVLPTWEVLGHSVTGQPIALGSIGTGPRTVLLVGTIHGDEAQGEGVIMRLLREIQERPSIIRGTRLLVVPVSNPDGKLRHTRGNARGVDLNRNFPTNWSKTGVGRTYGGPFPLSEPESRLLMALIEREHPSLIVSFHAAMMCNNFDGDGAEEIARNMARLNGYRLLQNIGYPTPGSLGQQAGGKMGIPIITLEVGHEADEPLYAKVRDSLMLAVAPGKR